jgi:hypothetical protein
MRSRFRPAGFSHSRSFSAPTVPSLRLTPPTPHGSFHEKDYDSDDSIPTSAAAMPRPNRYRRPSTRASSHPYATNGQPASVSPTFPPEQYQSINPGFFRGKLDDITVAAFSVVIAPDGRIFIEGQLVPKPAKYPSQDVQDRRSLSQPSSPLFFQNPIDPSIAALGLHNPPNSPTDGEIVSPQKQSSIAPHKQEHAVPLVETRSAQLDQVYLEQYDTYLTQYQPEQQNMWMWPVEQIPIGHG